MKKITFIGAGVGDIGFLTEEAMYSITRHKNIYTSEERFENLKSLNSRLKIIPYSSLEETIRKSEKDIAIVVSGDYGFYSIAKTMTRIFKDEAKIELINGINSMQYFSSKINQVYQDWVHISLHGSNKIKLLGTITYNEKVFIITSGKTNVNQVLKSLLEAGFKNLKVYVGENLGYLEEKITIGNIEDLCDQEFDELTVILIENPNVASTTPVKNSNLVSLNNKLSSEFIRLAAINTLQIEPTDVVYNIGAGAGDFSVEISKKANLGIVYAFEKDDTALEIMVKNKVLNNAYNILNIKTLVPQFDMEFYEQMNFIAPDKVIITGSSGKLESIFDWILELNPTCIITVVANSIEKLIEAKECYSKFSITPTINQLNDTLIQKDGNNFDTAYIFTGQLEKDNE